MSKSRWIIAATLGLALATSGQAQDQTESPNREAGQQNQPPYEPPLPFPVEIVEDDSTADARQRSEEEARQREIADLAAQKGMNAATQSIEVATHDMRDYALYSTILVGIGTFLAFGAFVLSLLANRSARAAVDVMRDEQRPWLALSISNDGPAEWRDGTLNFNFLLAAENASNSPALYVEFYAEAFVGKSSFSVFEHPERLRIEVITEKMATKSHFLTYASFPGSDPLKVKIGVSIPKADIDDFWRRNSTLADAGIIAASGLAVVSYRSSSDSDCYYTHVWFDISRKPLGNQNLNLAFKKNDYVPAEHVHVGAFHIGIGELPRKNQKT